MKQIVCFGDSNTYGLIPGTKDRYDYAERWTGILAEQLEKKGYKVAEEGLCGRTTIFDDPLRTGRRGTELLPIVLETHAPVDTVVVMLGTNDCKALYEASAQVIGLGIKKLIRQIKSYDEKIKILLVSPILLGEDIWNGYDPEFDAGSVTVSEGLKEEYCKIAKEEGTAFLAASDHAAPSPRDREHLDGEGHKVLAGAIGQKLEELLAIA